MASLFTAVESAGVVWLQALEQVGWFHGLIAVAHFVVAWLCFVNGHIARQQADGAETHGAWWLAASVLCLLGINSMLQLDLLVTQTVRSMARLDGWYGDRRVVQYLLLALLALVVWLVWGWMRYLFANNIRESWPVAYGLVLLLLLLMLRGLSAHGTDVLLHSKLVGVSVRRLLELVGLGLVAHGCWRCLQLR
jgi:hypothetical protein